MRLGFAAAISFLVVACGPADHEISEVNGVRAAYGEAQKTRKLTSDEMLRRAESSFSTVAFGVQYDELSALGLKMVEFGVCRRNKVCTWVDRQQVQHEADDDQGVDSKIIEIDQSSTKSINILGIGPARSRPEVLAAVDRFMPGLKFDCGRAPPDDIGSYCFAPVGDGFVEIKFDDDDRLLLARVEAKLEFPI